MASRIPKDRHHSYEEYFLMKNEKNDSHKIVAVLLGIAFFASLFFVHFPSAKVSTPTDKKLSINRKTYLLPETGERSYARLGYALLFDSLKKVTHVESWSHRNYPDEKAEVKLLPQELLVVANNPLRMWTPAEAKDLLAFVQRGGNALIITPTWQSFQNTGALLNCNYDKLEISKTIINLNTKYIELDNKINTIDHSLNEIKTMFNNFLLVIK